MTGRAQILVLIVAVIGAAVILWLVRRGHLKERFALLWLVIAAGLIVLVAVRPWLDSLSDTLGIRSGTTTLFAAAVLFLLGLILHLSSVVSSQEEKLRDLSESVALLRADLEEALLDDPASGQAVPPVEAPHEGQDEPQIPG